MMFALSRPDLPIGNNVLKLGVYTLGIYISHFIFIDLIKPIIPIMSPYVKDIGVPLAVYGLSLALSVVLSKNSYLQRTVI